MCRYAHEGLLLLVWNEPEGQHESAWRTATSKHCQRAHAPPRFEVGNDAAFNQLQSIVVERPHCINKDLVQVVSNA